MCDQQRLRPACAYAQSDQSLCLSLEYYMSVKLLTEHHLELLSLKGGCIGSSEYTLVKMSNCWKSHVAAHLPFSYSVSVLKPSHSTNRLLFSLRTHLTSFNAPPTIRFNARCFHKYKCRMWETLPTPYLIG